jgi:anti-sigma B factor antagonist
VKPNPILLDRNEDGVVVVLVEGEHDIYTAPSLREQVHAVLEERVPFVIDLTPATFIDSSILGVLLGARRRALEDGLGFAVCLEEKGDPAVRRILEVTGLIPVLPVVDSRQESVSTARSGPPEA